MARRYGRRTWREPTPEQVIEPARGATYAHAGEFAVYEYSEYGPSSVLAGQTKRCWIEGGFTSVEEAKAKYPNATVSESSLYQPPFLGHLPEEGEEW